MTCIVGVIDKGKVYIGGDSAAISDEDLIYNIREDEKVFRKGEFIFGFSSSFRMGQILRFKFNPPKKTAKMDDFEYMVTRFIDDLKKCFSDSDYHDFKDDGASFLVGYNGKLYEILSDFQVGISSEGYATLGCGSEIASGALYVCKDASGHDRVRVALEAAAHHSMGVRPPFKILSVGKEKTIARNRRKIQ